MNSPTIYHNPLCSKSRAALALLQAHGVTPRIVEYLKTPPSMAELAAIVGMLGIRPVDLVRKSEEIYRVRYAGKTLTDNQWFAAMVEHPVLIERPIVVGKDCAVIGRPPEKVLEVLENPAQVLSE